MTLTHKEKFSSQADPVVLSALREIATKEGRQFQAVLDEALRDYVDTKKNGKPRKHVFKAFDQSMANYDSLYRDLAK